MFTSIKNRFISALTPDLPPLPSPADYQLQLHRDGGGGGGSGSRHNHHHHHHHQQRQAQQQQMQDKFSYARPPFLQLLTMDELRASADHNVRPIIVPRDISLLPWGTGYAECVNSGKSEWNEDQAAFCRQWLSDPTHKHPDLPYTYFGIFDGHAGFGAALAASHQFHYILHEKLVDCIEMLLPRDEEEQTATKTTNGFPHPSHFIRRINKEQLIMGALESAFFHMDALIAQDRDRYRDAGGCTACVALFINGQMFVANAGDSRAVLCQRKVKQNAAHASAAPNEGSEVPALPERNSGNEDSLGAYPMPYSFDHTPETERDRLLNVALLKPHLLGKHYAAMEYARRPHMKELGQRILCRQGTMKGWTSKTLTKEDLRMPVVTGEGKRSRLLGTLGVTRGFGDHDLLAINTGTQIKPFLTPHPEVKIRDLSKIVSIPDEHNEDGDYGILVMATDGLWDVSENDAVARTVFQTLAKYPTEKHRYTMVAQELVAKARGKINDSGHWRLADSKAAATVDDISVIVIPAYQYYKEHIEWEKKCALEYQERLAKEAIEAKEKDSLLVNGSNEGDADADDDANAGKAHVVIENDDDEDEEIVVELNRQTVQAKIEVEEDKLQKSNENIATNAASAQKADTDDTENLKQHATIDQQINAAVNALEAAEINTADAENENNTKQTPEKSHNKTKHHQQQHHHQQQQQHRNRNRKDKH